MFKHCFLAVFVLSAFAAHAKDWDVRGKGAVSYNDGSGWKPIAGAHIRLMDSDTLIDETLGEGWTDGTGRFSVPGRGGDTGLPFGICDDNCTKPDPYVIVELKNDRIEVETEIGFTWHANTPTHDNTAGDIDFGSFQFASTDGQHAEILFGRTTTQYDFYTSQVGGRIPSHGGKINVLFPALLAAGVPWTTEESIHWPGSESRWNAVFHEFGHRIREAADGDFLHFLYDVARFTYTQQHWYTKQTNQGFAFNEGWAEYHSTLLDTSERSTFANWHVSGGDDIEGNVAAKLAHLANTCGGFKNMWAVLKDGTQVHSYSEFESAMKKKFPSCFKTAPSFVGKINPSIVKFVPITLSAQSAARANLLKSISASKPVVSTKLFLRPGAKIDPKLAPHVTVLTALHKLRADGRLAWHNAAVAAFNKHFAALKPIDEASIKSKSYLTDRANARHGFLQEALGAQLREVEKVKAEVQKQRADAKQAPLHKHFDILLARYDKRIAELKKALALKPAPDLMIPVHLLPRGFGAAIVAAK